MIALTKVGEPLELDKLTKQSILEEETFLEIMDEKDGICRERLIIDISDRATELGVKAKFDKLLKSYQKAEKDMLKAQKPAVIPPQNLNNTTNFGSEKYPDLFCGNWIADTSGIRTFSMFGECQACYHPILPVERLTNIESGTEKIVLAFFKGNRWREITVDKDQIASNTKIIALSNLGVSVTSENSRYLVKYLSDVENFNADIIPEKISTSRMGWIDGEFMPFTDNVLFDGDGKFDEVFNSIRTSGDYEKWLQLVIYYRLKGRTELKFYLAASFASVLIKPLNALPFWCNVWGGTGAGKTVAEMIAVSIWADPTNNRYIADFRTTDVATEVRMDFLNNLPMVVDDTATIKRKMGDNFSSMIYDFCSGKGKSRSNRNLGINREKTWRNVIFSSGESPLSNENLQGGAINRVLDLEASPVPIFDNGQEVVDIISQNFGFAGPEFIRIIKDIGIDEIKKMQQDILSELREKNKMEKQSVSLSILLTADKIATDYIFKDRQYLSCDEVESVLVDPTIVSENERCYDYILGEVATNPNKFNKNDFGNYQNEMWGCIQDDYVVILYNAFERICKQGNFSGKAFLSWANKQGLLKSDKGKNVKNKKFDGNIFKCVFLKKKDDEEEIDEQMSFEEPPF